MNRRTQVRFALTILLVQNTIGNASVAESNNAIEKVIAAIARQEIVVSVHALARMLDLPELPNKLVWRGPPDGNHPVDFSADYIPLESALGIRGVIIRWQHVQGKLRHSLSLALDVTTCPTVDSLEAAIGVKGFRAIAQNPHGGSTYPTTFWLLPRSNGERVHISYNGPKPCTVDISLQRDH